MPGVSSTMERRKNDREVSADPEVRVVEELIYPVVREESFCQNGIIGIRSVLKPPGAVNSPLSCPIFSRINIPRLATIVVKRDTGYLGSFEATGQGMRSCRSKYADRSETSFEYSV